MGDERVLRTVRAWMGRDVVLPDEAIDVGGVDTFDWPCCGLVEDVRDADAVRPSRHGPTCRARQID